MSNIRVGYLVVVVRDCCGKNIGAIRRVEAFEYNLVCHCQYCNKHYRQIHRAFFEGDEVPSAMPVAWLKRIPPLEELEGEQSKEELHV